MFASKYISFNFGNFVKLFFFFLKLTMWSSVNSEKRKSLTRDKIFSDREYFDTLTYLNDKITTNNVTLIM